MNLAALSNPESSGIAIIAGAGALPWKVYNACRRQGRHVLMVGFEGLTYAQPLETCEHIVVPLGVVAPILEAFQTSHIRDVVLAGAIERPPLRALRLDSLGRQILAQAGWQKLKGDDDILQVVVRFLEERGFRVCDPLEFEGEGGSASTLKSLGSVSAQDMQDIARGVAILEGTSALDIGQAVVVCEGLILGLETLEGTDALVARAGALKAERSLEGGVLVKLPKRHQELRVDRPAVGPHTVRAVHQAGLAGIALSTRTLVIEADIVMALCERLGVFLHVVDGP